ncbi:DNA-binding transcriptional ArsR family regulator [Rubricella aquisinus]|uniref:DNA-binding transcriptional ArsR family regulator n=1 Tax=Rubricella aquisinus TaxID=2028108 RepID=A0A840WSP8_9RHOB|nr:metalloregulator ArsR/SmtB family transcription factor [Rubricella aquisinus]MBB5517033.1 DNA-binding transcriptional ArsR family regulator [Rubricella aquisinus]
MRSQTNALNTEYYTRVFKAISHEGRLAIVLELHKRDLSVSQLEQATRQRQTVVSQQLARLRKDDLVDFERAGKAVIYRISDPRLREMIDLLQGLAERGDAE